MTAITQALSREAASSEKCWNLAVKERAVHTVSAPWLSMGCLAVVRYWLGELYYVTRYSERKRKSR